MDLVIARELQIFGSHGMPACDYPAMLALVANQKLRPDLLITRQIGLNQAPAALATMDHATSAGMTIVKIS